MQALAKVDKKRRKGRLQGFQGVHNCCSARSLGKPGVDHRPRRASALAFLIRFFARRKRCQSLMCTY